MKKPMVFGVVFAIILAAASSAQADTTYTVRPGDKLRTDVLDAFGVTLGEVRDANPGKIGSACGWIQERTTRSGGQYSVCRRIRYYLIAGTVLAIPESRVALKSRADDLQLRLDTALAQVANLRENLARETERHSQAAKAVKEAPRKNRATARAESRQAQSARHELPLLPATGLAMALLAAALWASASIRRKNRLITELRTDRDNAARQARDVRKELDGERLLLQQQAEEQKRSIGLLELAAKDRKTDPEAKERPALEAALAKTQTERDGLELEKMRSQTELQDVSSERDRLDGELAALLDRIRAELRAEIEARVAGELEATRTAMRERLLRELQPEAEAKARSLYESSIQRLTTDVGFLEEERQRLRKELAQSRTETEAKARELDEAERERTEAIRNLEARHQTELGGLRSQVEAETEARYGMTISLHKSELGQLADERQRLEDELARSKVEAEAKAREWGEKLVQALESARTLKVLHEAELEALHRELAELRPKLEAEFAAADELRISQLQGEIRTLDTECRDLKNQLSSSQDELARSKVEAEEKAREWGEKLVQAQEAVRTLKAQHEAELTSLGDMIRNELRTEVESGVQELYEARIEKLRTDRESFREEQAKTEAESRRLSEEKAEVERLKRELEGRVAIASQREKEAGEKMAAAEQQLSAVAESQARLDHAWEEYFRSRTPAMEVREAKKTPPFPTAVESLVRTPPFPMPAVLPPTVVETLEDMTEHAREEPAPADLPREVTAIVPRPPPDGESVVVDPEVFFQPLPKSEGMGFLCIFPGCAEIVGREEREAHLESHREGEGSTVVRPKGGNGADPHAETIPPGNLNLRPFPPEKVERTARRVSGAEVFDCKTCGAKGLGDEAQWVEHCRRGHLECFMCSPPVIIQSDNLTRHLRRAHPEHVGKPAKARRKQHSGD